MCRVWIQIEGFNKGYRSKPVSKEIGEKKGVTLVWNVVNTI